MFILILALPVIIGLLCTAFMACSQATDGVEIYAVTYDANGATGGIVPAVQTKTQGMALTLAANSGNLAKTGCTFAGWNTDADGIGTPIPPAQATQHSLR